MINKVTLVGNLGKDPEVRHLENGSSVARFSVATNENYRDKAGEWHTRTEWHIVVVWRALAESAERNLKKGSMAYIEGRLRTRTYQDSNGIEKSITEIEGQVLRSLDRKERSGNEAGFPSANDEPGNYKAQQPVQSPTSPTPSEPSNQPTSTAPPKQDMPEDDLPF